MSKRWRLLLGLSFLLLLVLLLGNCYAERKVSELRETYTYPESAFLEVQGMPVHYRRIGDGPHLLLLHGTGATLHTWEDWTAALRDSFDIISVTLPAFGLTGPHPDEDYSIGAYVDFLAAFTAKTGLDSFYLAGNSLGGLIAWEYALAHPQQVRKLVLLNAAGWPRDKAMPLAMRLARLPGFKLLLQRVTPKSLFRKSLREVYANPSRINDTLVDRYFQLFLREGNRRAYVQRLNQPKQSDPGRLRQLDMPTLILWGEKDAWIPVADAYRFKAVLPHAKLKVYPDAGHVPMEEWPQRTARDVSTFLRSN